MRLLLIVGVLCGSFLAVTRAEKVVDDCVLASSCGQCIQKGAQCAWCMDPESPLSSRCQNRSRLEASGKCRKENIYTPVTELIVSDQTVPIGGKSHYGTEVMMEPQVVQMKVKKGDNLVSKFKYKHVRPANDPQAVNVQLQTSDLPAELDVKFFIICRGKRVETKKCANVADGELVDIEVQVGLKDCSKVTGTMSFSLGVVGYSAVVGIYVNPICGCECEILRYHEKSSPFCSRAGNLICGQCICDAGKGGNTCECPLASFGVSSARDLEDKCRETPNGPICGGNGKCKCGRCECDSLTVSGEFCSCDNTSCPIGAEDRQCSGRGLCKCGKCECESGWERDDCSCPKGNDKCMENGELCSMHGHCECGRCVCDTGYTGAFCGSSEGKTDMTEETTMQEESNKQDADQLDDNKQDMSDDKQDVEEGMESKDEDNTVDEEIPAVTIETTKEPAPPAVEPQPEDYDDQQIESPDATPAQSQKNTEEFSRTNKAKDCGPDDICPIDVQGAHITPQEDEASAEEQSSSTSSLLLTSSILMTILTRFIL